MSKLKIRFSFTICDKLLLIMFDIFWLPVLCFNIGRGNHSFYPKKTIETNYISADAILESFSSEIQW